MTTLEKLERFFLDDILPSGDWTIGPDDDLVGVGFLDSLGFAKLIVYMSQEFNVKVDEDDVKLENFSSMRAIESFLTTKRKK